MATLWNESAPGKLAGKVLKTSKDALEHKASPTSHVALRTPVFSTGLVRNFMALELLCFTLKGEHYKLSELCDNPFISSMLCPQYSV